MLTIQAVAGSKKYLPEMMALAIERHRRRGVLDGLIHIKDDVIHELAYGWEILGCWGTPDEVDARGKTSLVEAVKEKLYSSEDPRELVSIIWDTFIENYSDVDLFQEDVLNALRGPDVIRDLLCVLNNWSDRLG